MSELIQVSIGKEEAIRLSRSSWWIGLESQEIFKRQMQTLELMMDFSTFHEAAEKALGRPVWTHEFARPQYLWDEFEGTRIVANPLATSLETLDEIMEPR